MRRSGSEEVGVDWSNFGAFYNSKIIEAPTNYYSKIDRKSIV